MNTIVIFMVITTAFANADEEPFSIGLGTLSPSYTQRVGEENVKVTVQQKDNGFAYTIGDPQSGSSSFFNLGAGAHEGPGFPLGFEAPLSGFYGSSDFPSSGQYSPPISSAGQYSPESPAGQYTPESPAAQYTPASPGYEGFSGYTAPEKEVPGTYQGGSSAPASESGMGFLPAGFSYHGTEGQAFLRQGDGPDFMISDNQGKDSQSDSYGPAQKSFQNFGGMSDKSFNPFPKAGQSSGPSGLLANGLVGYGSGRDSQQGILPIGGFAKREHGGHTIEDM